MKLTIAETLSHLHTSFLILVEVEDRDIVDVITSFLFWMRFETVATWRMSQ